MMITVVNAEGKKIPTVLYFRDKSEQKLNWLWLWIISILSCLKVGHTHTQGFILWMLYLPITDFFLANSQQKQPKFFVSRSTLYDFVGSYVECTIWTYRLFFFLFLLSAEIIFLQFSGAVILLTLGKWCFLELLWSMSVLNWIWEAFSLNSLFFLDSQETLVCFQCQREMF